MYIHTINIMYSYFQCRRSMYQKRRYEWDLKAFVFFRGIFLMISEPEENTVSHNSTVDKFFTTRVDKFSFEMGAKNVRLVSTFQG